jgi:hypothetical protein
MRVATIQNINGQAITLFVRHKNNRDPVDFLVHRWKTSQESEATARTADTPLVVRPGLDSDEIAASSDSKPTKPPHLTVVA